MDISIITKVILKTYLKKWFFDPFNRQNMNLKNNQKFLFSYGKRSNQIDQKYEQLPPLDHGDPEMKLISIIIVGKTIA